MIDLPRTPDVLVVGGGVIGCAIAQRMARPGRSVLVVDRGAIGGEASGAAAGVLAVASGSVDGGPRLALERASLGRFPGLARDLANETGIDVEYAACGVVDLLLDDDDRRAAEATYAQRTSQGFRMAWWDQVTLRAEEPYANQAAFGALVALGDAQVTNDRLVDALAASSRLRGAVLAPGCPVDAIEHDGGRVGRVRAANTWITPGVVVLAAGAWTSRLAGFDAGVAVEPRRGQMLALRPPPRWCRRVLNHRDGYLVPRRNGDVLVGATVEDAGFDKHVTANGLRELSDHVARIAPAGLAMPIARTWAGLRPFAPAGCPLIGWSPRAANVLVAGGHHRNGILLAPITAEVVAALVEGGTPPVDVATFAPRSL